MRTKISVIVLSVVAATLCAPAAAQISAQPTDNVPRGMPTEANRPVTLEGKVVMEDGSPVAESVEVQRVCGGVVHSDAYTDMKGKFTILLDDKADRGFQGASENGGYGEMGTNLGGRVSRTTRTQLWNCEVRAVLPGYRAATVSLSGREFSGGPVDLGAMVLKRISTAAGSSISLSGANAPDSAKKEYNKGREEFAKKKYDDAEKHLKKAVDLYPQYASAHDMRGRALRAGKQDDAAATSFQAAIDADPKYVPPYLHLAALDATRNKWEDVVRLSNKAIELDPLSYPDAYYFKTVGSVMLKDIPAAKQSALKVIELDKEHRFPRAELILGNILRVEGNAAEANEHYRTYIALDPNGPDVANIKTYLAEQGQAQAAPKQDAKPN